MERKCPATLAENKVDSALHLLHGMLHEIFLPWPSLGESLKTLGGSVWESNPPATARAAHSVLKTGRDTSAPSAPMYGVVSSTHPISGGDKPATNDRIPKIFGIYNLGFVEGSFGLWPSNTPGSRPALIERIWSVRGETVEWRLADLIRGLRKWEWAAQGRRSVSLRRSCGGTCAAEGMPTVVYAKLQNSKAPKHLTYWRIPLQGALLRLFTGRSPSLRATRRILLYLRCVGRRQNRPRREGRSV